MWNKGAFQHILKRYNKLIHKILLIYNIFFREKFMAFSKS